MNLRFKFILLSFVVNNILCFSQRYEQPKDRNVGEIAFDSSIDDAIFSTCNEDSNYNKTIYQTMIHAQKILYELIEYGKIFPSL